MENRLLLPYTQKGFFLKNHLVMAPMTRSRAIGNVPGESMAEYYGQRSGAGLIVTEGTAPAPSGLGYPRIPGIFSQAQIDGWRKVTTRVHAHDGKIFVQLMHTGRIGHIDNLPEGYTLVGVTGERAVGKIFTDTQGLQDYSEPTALTTAGVAELVADHVAAAANAIEAGFDGIELHGANGYLIEQFLNPNLNTRTDAYGGSIQRRAKIVIDLAQQIADRIGKEKVGIRFSPYSSMGDLAAYDPKEVHDTYVYLAGALHAIGIAYIHVGVSPALSPATLEAIRAGFGGTIILCNGFTPASAEKALGAGVADLVAFGRSFLANPDLDRRIAEHADLNTPDPSTFYTVGAKGYTDYPVLNL